MLVEELGDVHGATLAVGVASVFVLVFGRRVIPWFPSTLLTLILAIAASAALDSSGHGVDVVGDLPSALPDFAFPDVGAADRRPAPGAARTGIRSGRSPTAPWWCATTGRPELWLAAPQAGVRKRIRAAGLDGAIHIAPTIDAALAGGERAA